MENFKTPEQLIKLSKAIISQSESKIETYKIGWQYIVQLVEAIKMDIELLFDANCYIAETRIIIEDEFYRQSANAVVFEIRFEKDETLTVVAECLIDVGRVWLSVKNKPSNNRLYYIADRIERKYNSEFLADITRIYR